MIKKYMDLVPRYLMQNKKKTAISALSITLSVFLLTSVGIFINSYNMSMVEASGQFAGKYHGMYRNIEYDNKDKLKDNPMLSQLGTYLEIGSSSIGNYTLLIAGSDETAAELQNNNIIRGRFPQNDNEIAIEEWICNKLPDKPQIGDSIKLDYTLTKEDGGLSDVKAETTFTLSGILNNTLGSRSSEIGKAYTTLSTAENIIPRLKRHYKQFFRIKDSLPLEPTLEKIKALGEVKKANENYLGNFKANQDYFNVLKRAAKAKYLITFVDIIVSIAVIMIIYNTFNISVIERIRHFGLLKAIGITSDQIKKMLFAEALFLAVIFVPIGILLGVFGTKVLFAITANISNFTADTNNAFLLNTKVYVSAFNILLPAFLGFMAVIGAIYGPARMGSEISPIESINPENKILKKQGAISRSTGKKASFLLGCSWKIAFENLRRNKKRFLATVISMSVSIALFLLVNYFIGSLDPFNLSSYRVGSDYVLGLRDYNVNFGYSEEAINKIREIPGIKSINPMKYAFADISLNPDQVTENCKKKYKELAKTSSYVARGIDEGIYDIPIFIYGCSDEKIKELAGEDKADLYNEDDVMGVYIVQNLMYANETDLKNGDYLNAARAFKINGVWKKQDLQFKIIDVFEELPIKNGATFNGALITREEYLNEYMDLSDYQMIEICLDKNADAIMVESKLEDIAAAQQYGRLKSFREDYELFRNIQLQLGIILYSLTGVIAVVGLINIINTMSMNVILRRREFAMMRALGMTKRQLRSVILTEGFYYGFISSLAGSIAGVLLVYWFYYKARTILPIELNMDAGTIGMTCITAIIFSMGATLFPLKKVNSLNVIESIQATE